MKLEAVLALGQVVELDAAVEGQPVGIAGRLAACDAATLSVLPLPGTDAFLLAPGDLVQARLATPHGLYRFETQLAALRGATLVLARPARATRVQRRAFARATARLPVTLSFGAGAEIPCTTIDLSAGGLRLRPAAPIVPPPARDAFADLRLTLEAAEPPLACKCRVVRAAEEGDELGVELVALADLDRARLAAFVDARVGRRAAP